MTVHSKADRDPAGTSLLDDGVRLVPRTRQQGPESVLIVGGGATGIVSLRNLVQERGQDEQGSYPLFHPTLVERREELGGVWYWSDDTYALEQRLGPVRVQGQSPIVDEDGKPHWPSPAYLNLRGNVLPEFLEFSGLPFKKPEDGETFPSLQETCDYLQEFARPYSEYVQCRVEVVRIDELHDDRGWQATLRYWDRPAHDQIKVQCFDRVLVAAGWYDTPFYPAVPGTDEARQAGHIHHCKHYRDAFAYAPTIPPTAPNPPKIIVVGNNNSANEVATHLALFATPQNPVYKSCKSAQIAKCPSLPDDERVRDVGLITNYSLKPAGGSSAVGKTKLDVTLADGQVIHDVDYVILGTGYGQKYPFVHVLPRDTHGRVVDMDATTVALTPDELKGTRVPGMYNHCLWSCSSRLTLGFVGLVVSFWPFNMADLMSAWIVGVWAGKIATVPSSITARLQFEQDRLEHLYQRKLATQPTLPLLRQDTTTYTGAYHLIGGSTVEGPPNELDFARGLLADLHTHHPTRARHFNSHHSWDLQREHKQHEMYEIKRQWLHTNAQRIRKDPFDLLGTSANSRKYRHLAIQSLPSHADDSDDAKVLLVHPDLLPAT